MKRSVYLVLVAVVVLGMVTSIVWAAKGGRNPKATNGVVVTTVDASGKGKTVPMPGVTVELYLANGEWVATGLTDNNAQVAFPILLPYTDYRLKGIAPDGRLTAGGFTTNSYGTAKDQTLSFWQPAQ